MIKVNEIKIPLDMNSDYKIYISKRMGIEYSRIKDYTISKWAVDARKKDNIYFVMNAIVDIVDEDKYIKLNKDNKIAKYTPKIKETRVWEHKDNNEIIVVGSGPSGLFVALTLAKSGKQVTILERGYTVEKRAEAIKNLENKGILDTKCNIQFGEGGAGTYSDGKLTTGIKSPYIDDILDTFVECGATPNIKYISKPHIGSDILAKVIVNMRKMLEKLGCKVLFEHKLSNVHIVDDKVNSIDVETNAGTINMPCDTLILAIGHSARDTIHMLYDNGIKFEQKPFSMGVRIEHLQEDINKSQYGKYYKHKNLKPADYKLFTHLPNGRTVYTFCMCPGGYVVPSTSIDGCVVTNGMSLSDRAGVNANSGLLVSINPSDYPTTHPLSGCDLQEQYEKLAYKKTADYRAIVQRVGDFLENKPTTHLGKVQPTYKPGVVLDKIDDILPKYVVDSLREALPILDKDLHGFADPDALLTGIESRTSAPYRIPRDDGYMCNIQNIYPIGEGAGYAGGIVSSAVDGVKLAHLLIDKNNKKD